MHGILWHWIENDAEETAGTRIIALPDGMVGMARKSRIQHAGHFRPRFEPAGHVESRHMVLGEAHSQRAQTPQPKIYVVRADAETHRKYQPDQRRPCGLGGR